MYLIASQLLPLIALPPLLSLSQEVPDNSLPCVAVIVIRTFFSPLFMQKYKQKLLTLKCHLLGVLSKINATLMTRGSMWAVKVTMFEMDVFNNMYVKGA